MRKSFNCDATSDGTDNSEWASELALTVTPEVARDT